MFFLPFAHFQFQYGAQADIYSLNVIFFELFSGRHPFPGTIYQVYQAKLRGEKPVVPANFPSDLKELVFQSFSIEPKKRPPLENFQPALNKMLTLAGTEENQSVTRQEVDSLTEKDEQHFPLREVSIALEEISNKSDNISTDTDTREQLWTNLEAGM
jgi:serine/threonine protein kinase